MTAWSTTGYFVEKYIIKKNKMINLSTKKKIPITY